MERRESGPHYREYELLIIYRREQFQKRLVHAPDMRFWDLATEVGCCVCSLAASRAFRQCATPGPIPTFDRVVPAGERG